MIVGKSVPRVDAYDKVTGRAKYTDDLCEKNALIGKIVHSTIANGMVKHIDTSEAEKIPGVVKIVTCFDSPVQCFPTDGHPWCIDPAHQGPQDRRLLNARVRLYGDDIAAVVAEDEISANRAVRAIKVEYEEYPVLLDPIEAMKDGASQLHAHLPNNILGHTSFTNGDVDEAVKEPGLIKVEGWYETPTVQHAHIEPPISYAYMEAGRIVVVASTQIPHICRRVIGQALGVPWGKVRVVKPYLGGGFGNKQDVLYEPLNAWLSVLVGGRLVKLELTREETFYGTRVRHAMKVHLTSYVRPDGKIVAREGQYYSNQGAYGSHAHSVCSKAMTAFRQLYPVDHFRVEGWTVHTNTATSGAMRGYGTPQTIFALESHAEDIATALKMEPIAFRQKNMMPQGFFEPFTKNVNRDDTFNQCMAKAREYIKWDEKRKAYANQTGPIRRGVGMALLWYNTGLWPIATEISSCRLVLNQDGSVQLQIAEPEIGQGADTVFAQMAAETLSIRLEDVHIVTTQDTDITPFGAGAYGSRQTYVGGAAVKKAAMILKDKILQNAYKVTRMQPENVDIHCGDLVIKATGQKLMTLGEFAAELLYSLDFAQHLTSEATAQVKSNAYSFGCCFTEVEVDIPLGKVKVLDMINVHDCGCLINPALAAAQVHGGQSMGIGFGVSEKLLYDEKTGKPLNPNLLDYKLCTTMDHPHLEAQFVENFEPTSAFGTKSLGEPPTVPIAPAIRNAVLNATGVAVDSIPLSPHTLFPAFRDAGLIPGNTAAAE